MHITNKWVALRLQQEKYISIGAQRKDSKKIRRSAKDKKNRNACWNCIIIWEVLTCFQITLSLSLSLSLSPSPSLSPFECLNGKDSWLMGREGEGRGYTGTWKPAVANLRCLSSLIFYMKISNEACFWLHNVSVCFHLKMVLNYLYYLTPSCKYGSKIDALKCTQWGLPWWSSGWESILQCRGHRFDPWSGN